MPKKPPRPAPELTTDEAMRFLFGAKGVKKIKQLPAEKRGPKVQVRSKGSAIKDKDK